MTVEADDKQQQQQKHSAPRKPASASRMKGEALYGGGGSEGFSAATDGWQNNEPHQAERGDAESELIMPRLMTPGVSPAMAGVLNNWVSDATPSTDTVARRSEGNGHAPSQWDIGSYAQQGLKGTPTSLPYRDKLESSFGQSLGDISVYQGGEAAKAADALDARAYAYRGSIVLGESGSDLRTVAEETAHVLQQRGGAMAGHGPMTDPSSPVELEAATAADAVVSGHSVSSLSQGLGNETVARTPTTAKKPGTAYPGGAGQSLLGGRGQGSSRQVQNYQKVSTEELLKDKMDPKELDTYRSTVAKKAPDLTESQATAHAHAQGAIYQDRVAQGKTVEEVGNDNATQMSKVLGGDGQIADMLSGHRGHTAGGSIGYAETSAGRSAQETKQILGLDYAWSGNPFVKDGNDLSKGFNDDGLTFIQFGMTNEMKDATRVSTNDTFQSHVQDLQKDASDTLAQFPTFNTQETKANDAYRGTGTTGTSELVDGLDTMNQELTFAQDKGGTEQKAYLDLPDGTKMMYRDKAGDDAMVATLKTNEDTGEQSWMYNDELAKSKPEVLQKHVTLELEKLTQRATDAKSALDEKNGELVKLKQKQTQKKSEVSGLEAKVAQARNAAKSADDAGKAAADKAVADAEQKLAAAKAALEQIDREVDELKTRVDELQAVYDKDKAKLDGRKPTLDALLEKCKPKK